MEFQPISQFKLPKNLPLQSGKFFSTFELENLIFSYLFYIFRHEYKEDGVTENPIAVPFGEKSTIGSGLETIPDHVICYFDIIIALDLDCADFNENPVIGGFATQLVDQIFNQFDGHVQDGAIRIGIVGFHSELEIAMNLFELSTIDGRSSARADAIKAINDLQSFALSRRNYKTSSVRDTFASLARSLSVQSPLAY